MDPFLSDANLCSATNSWSQPALFVPASQEEQVQTLFSEIQDFPVDQFDTLGSLFSPLNEEDVSSGSDKDYSDASFSDDSYNSLSEHSEPDTLESEDDAYQPSSPESRSDQEFEDTDPEKESQGVKVPNPSSLHAHRIQI